MPRITHKQPLERYRWVQDAWVLQQNKFSFLTTRDQHYLHDDYNPSIAMGEDEVLAYRKMVARHDPGLPQKAGRALRHLELAVEVGVRQPGSRVTVTSTQGRRIHAAAVARPDIDTELVAKELPRQLLHDGFPSVGRARSDSAS